MMLGCHGVSRNFDLVYPHNFDARGNPAMLKNGVAPTIMASCWGSPLSIMSLWFGGGGGLVVAWAVLFGLGVV